jgi:hypothetical protein
MYALLYMVTAAAAAQAEEGGRQEWALSMHYSGEANLATEFSRKQI